jgi:hypothetical protein
MCFGSQRLDAAPTANVSVAGTKPIRTRRRRRRRSGPNPAVRGLRLPLGASSRATALSGLHLTRLLPESSFLA